MRLVLHKHTVSSLRVGAGEGWSDGVLSVDVDTVARLFPEQQGLRFAGLRAAAPGARLRFGPVLDVTEIRCCAQGAAFPGLTGPEAQGEVRSLTILENAALAVVSNLQGVQEGLIDMASAWSPFSDMHMLICLVDVSPELNREEADAAIRLFQYRLSEHLAALAAGAPDARQEELDWQPDPPGCASLPMVGAVYFIQSQGALRRTYLYGQAADSMTPRFLHPFEPLAGALSSGNYVMPSNKTCSFIHQRAPVLRALLERHGRDWRFGGVLLAPEPSTRKDKEATAQTLAAMARERGFAGVIINQEGGGNADMDIMLACRAMEKQGIASVLLLNEFAGPDGRTPSLTESVPEARFIVSTGNNEHLAELAGESEWAGFPLETPLFEDGTGLTRVPLSRIYASANQLGFGQLSCETL